jgi:hypothetical protein
MHLDVSDCSEITILPESLGELKSLVHLTISYCFEITVLPESLGGLKSLVHHVMVFKNYCPFRITWRTEKFGKSLHVKLFRYYYASRITR